MIWLWETAGQEPRGGICKLGYEKVGGKKYKKEGSGERGRGKENIARCETRFCIKDRESPSLQWHVDAPNTLKIGDFLSE